MKLSIIVPIYNVESYLRKCVESLMAQDYDDYEIILVDDGSTDGSGDLADSLAASPSSHLATSPKIRVIHRPNGGLSAARNSGIEVAQGEYICFVDSDDYWEPNVLGGLMAQIEQDRLDALRFVFRNVNEMGEVVVLNNPWGIIEYNEKITNGKTFLNERLGYACYAVQFILKRDLFSQNDALFLTGVLFEDTDWIPRIMSKIQRIADANVVVYNYLLREGSISKANSTARFEREVEQKLALITRLKEYQYSRCYALDTNPNWYDGMVTSLVVSILKVASEPLWSERNEIIKQLKKMNIYPLQTHHLRKKMQNNALLINLSPRVFVWMRHVRA